MDNVKLDEPLIVLTLRVWNFESGSLSSFSYGKSTQWNRSSSR